MQKDKIIKNAITFLQKDLIEKGTLDVTIIQMTFFNQCENSQISGEFACIRADEYDEGFYYNPFDGKYYYYGEAFLDNPGSFSNKFAFPIEGENLDLIPENLKDSLKRVGKSGIPENINSDQFQ